jgi:hypothetical protein
MRFSPMQAAPFPPVARDWNNPWYSHDDSCTTEVHDRLQAYLRLGQHLCSLHDLVG